MNYFELVIAGLLTVLMSLLLLQSLIVDSPMKEAYVSFSLLMFAASLAGLLLVVKEMKRARKEAEL